MAKTPVPAPCRGILSDKHSLLAFLKLLLKKKTKDVQL